VAPIHRHQKPWRPCPPAARRHGSDIGGRKPSKDPVGKYENQRIERPAMGGRCHASRPRRFAARRHHSRRKDRDLFRRGAAASAMRLGGPLPSASRVWGSGHQFCGWSDRGGERGRKSSTASIFDATFRARPSTRRPSISGNWWRWRDRQRPAAAPRAVRAGRATAFRSRNATRPRKRPAAISTGNADAGSVHDAFHR